MFAIRLCPHRGEAFGEIVIDSFQETFELDLQNWSASDYEQSWTRSLGELIAGADRVALMTWASAPGSDRVRRAWVLYRSGDEVFVQERLFLPDADDVALDPHGRAVSFQDRAVESDDGGPVSEWRTTVSDIRAFVVSRTN